MPGRTRFHIGSQVDVEEARRVARALSAATGLGSVDVQCVVIAVSELATNLLRYARDGELELTTVARPGAVGIEVLSTDTGPGIPDIDLALTDGFSSGSGLGSGLPAVRRLMDEFDIQSRPDGTRIRACKWVPTP